MVVRNKGNKKQMKFAHSPFIIIACGGSLGALSRFYLSIFIDAWAVHFGGVFMPIEIGTTSALKQALGPTLGVGIIPEISINETLQLSSSSLSIALFFSIFPLAVLLINMLGSLILGAFITYIQYAKKNNMPLRNLFTISFLGSLTTFSTFIIDTIKGVLPFILQSTSLLEMVPNLKNITYSFDVIYPSYARGILATHLFIFSIANVLLNVSFCIMCVWIGHGFIKKFYGIKQAPNHHLGTN